MTSLGIIPLPASQRTKLWQLDILAMCSRFTNLVPVEAFLHTSYEDTCALLTVELAVCSVSRAHFLRQPE